MLLCMNTKLLLKEASPYRSYKMKLTIINEEIYLKDKQQFKDFNIDCHYNDLLEDNLNSLIFDDDDYPHILHLSFLQDFFDY